MLAGYEMIIANSALRVSLASYHLISNTHSLLIIPEKLLYRGWLYRGSTVSVVFIIKCGTKKLVASKAVHFFTISSSQCLAGSYLAGHLVCFSFVVVIR